MSEEVEVHPGVGRATLGAAQHLAVEAAGGVEVGHVEGEMEQAAPGASVPSLDRRWRMPGGPLGSAVRTPERPVPPVHNPGMPLSRRLPLFVRLVLTAWLLALGAAIAAPAVQPSTLEMICSGGVMKLVAQGQDDSSPSPDCPLCAPPGLLAGEAFTGWGIVPGDTGSVLAEGLAPKGGHAAIPPPARGPPAFLLA